MFFRPVGEIFEFDGKKIEVVEVNDKRCISDDYRRCFFWHKDCSNIEKRGSCDMFHRDDRKEVVFIEVKSQEIGDNNSPLEGKGSSHIVE